MAISRVVSEMDVLPRGYAVAYWRPGEMRAVCYPVGLHVVVSLARATWLAFRRWRAPDVIERAYERGREDGRRLAAQARDRARADIENDAIHRFVLGIIAPAPVTTQDSDHG